MTSRPAGDVVARFTRGGLRIAVGVMAGWHVAVSLPFVVIVWARYGLTASGAPIWAGYAALGAVTAVAALRVGGPDATERSGTGRGGLVGRGWRGGVLPWAVCALLLAGALANELTMPGGFFGRNAFGFTTAGWFALVALWWRRLGEILGFFAANVAVGLLALVLLRETSRPDLAMFIIESVGSNVFQVTIYVGSRAVAGVAGRAARAAEAAVRARHAQLAAEAVQADRVARHTLLRTTVAGLLDGLAAGTLDLTVARTRQDIAVAVTRLRRYLVEHDDVPDPLSHELRACADAAERRGVAVDLVATAGTIPLLGVAVRRALVEPVIEVLAAAASRARITVVASETEVAVAILADALLPGPATRAAADGRVCYDWDEEGGGLWAQARWTQPSG